MRRLFCALVLGAVVIPANATTYLYEYTGNSFNIFEDDLFIAGSYDTSMRITAKIWSDTLFPEGYSDLITNPVAVSFSDGRYTYIEQEQDIYWGVATIQADANGSIIGWHLVIAYYPDDDWQAIGEEYGIIGTYSFEGYEEFDIAERRACPVAAIPGQACDNLAIDHAENRASPGVWTVTAVPVPTAVWLLGSALGLLSLGRARHVGS